MSDSALLIRWLKQTMHEITSPRAKVNMWGRGGGLTLFCCVWVCGGPDSGVEVMRLFGSKYCGQKMSDNVYVEAIKGH